MPPKWVLGGPLDVPWTALGCFGDPVGSFGGILGRPVELLGSSLGALGGFLGPLGDEFSKDSGTINEALFCWLSNNKFLFFGRKFPSQERSLRN